MKTLAETFAQYPDSDKGSLHSYLEVYEKLFELKRLQVTALLEVGVRYGGSLRAWADYFPNARIYGIDDGSEDGIWRPDRAKIEILVADTTRPQMMADVLNRFGRGYFDIIIDDGLHRSWAQAATYGTLRPYLASDGCYVIEDIEHYEEALKMQAIFGGTLEDRRAVKGRHDDILLYFT